MTAAPSPATPPRGAMQGAIACPICDGREARELYRFDPARSIPGRVVRCATCTTVYKVLADPSKPPSAYYDDTYASYDYWTPDAATLRALGGILGAITARVRPRGATLLDVGCGSGIFLGLAKERGFAVTGFELNEKLADKAREHAGAEVIHGDFLETPLEGRRFDVITMLDLIEHVPDPIAAIAKCAEHLAPRGELVLYTPNHSGLIVRIADLLYRATLGKVARPVVEIFDCTHLVFFDVATLTRAVEAAGLERADVAMSAYDPERAKLATGVSALGVRGIEAVAPLVGGEFRILMFARKP